MDPNSFNDPIKSQSLGGKNRSPPPSEAGQSPTALSDLNETEKRRTLYNNGADLFGIHIDSNAGPRRCTAQVAKRTGSSPYPLSANREINNIVTEMILTETVRKTNFAHQGWSESAISTATPWILSRMAKNNHLEPLTNEPYITKRITLQRLSVHLTLKVLLPVPEFEASIEDALSKPTKFRRFEALRETFEFWGDVIALEFDLGTSISTTDLEANIRGLNDNAGPIDLATFKTARISTLGGEATLVTNSDRDWLTRPVHPHQWAQVRVLKVAPVTALLRTEIQEQIAELYSTLWTYRPLALDGIVHHFNKSFDGAPHILKTISSIVLQSSGHVDAVDVVYMDGTRSVKHGGNGGTDRIFTLAQGEHVTEVLLWADTEWVYALQFTTSYRRVSPHYGGGEGTPTILHSKDGILVAFSGKSMKHPKWEKEIFQQIQTIWRHDVIPTRPDVQNIYFEYFGSTSGYPFNDLPFLESLDSACISNIRVRCGAYIDGIQITYTGIFDGRTVKSDAPHHGGQTGGHGTFQLEPGEHIVTVSGRQKEEIVQLCFVTNLGRTSGVYGGGQGTPFTCQAPPAGDGSRMRLRYIAGKCGKYLNGLLFVWTKL